MVLKTFNLDELTYKKYSSHCKKAGISMSRQIDRFISQQLTSIETATRPVTPMKHEELDAAKPNVGPHRASNEHSMRRFC